MSLEDILLYKLKILLLDKISVHIFYGQNYFLGICTTTAHLTWNVFLNLVKSTSWGFGDLKNESNKTILK